MKNTLDNIEKMFYAMGEDFTQENVNGERGKALRDIHARTGRNVVLYYSDDEPLIERDLDGFISACSGLKGDTLDLIFHGNGGYAETAERIANYLRGKFASVRVVIPFEVTSAASMLACSADEIVMASHSFLGPTDPQYGENFVSGHVILKRMKWFYQESDHGEMMSFIERHGNVFIEIEDIVQLGELLVEKWLREHMFKDDSEAIEKSKRIGTWLSDQNTHKVANRPLPLPILREQGLKVVELEKDQQLYDAVMKAHYITEFETRFGLKKLIVSHAGDQYKSFHDLEEIEDDELDEEDETKDDNE